MTALDEESRYFVADTDTFVAFCLVLLGLLGFLPSFSGLYRVLPNFCWVLPGFTFLLLGFT